jgi:hypothetical protein
MLRLTVAQKVVLGDAPDDPSSVLLQLFCINT